MKSTPNRREFLQGLGVAAAGLYFAPAALLGKAAPTAPVAIARCPAYGPGVTTALAGMFDQLGGLTRLVKGKTVAIKLNVTGSATERLYGLPQGNTYWVHPQVVGTTVELLEKAGARRVRLLESPTISKAGTLEEYLSQAGWAVADLRAAGANVEFENTNFPGPSNQYARLWVPGGGMLFKAYDVNRAYVDCDVFISLAKLKEHSTSGMTGAMKNLFGVPPTNIYGEGVGFDEPSKTQCGARAMLHEGKRQPPKSSLPEIDPQSPRSPGFRVPRVTVDLAAARPIHLSIIDGIETVTTGEGPWVKNMRTVRPGVLLAGTNCVATDAVATALMGFDPMAERGTAPFENCDSTLRLAEQAGLGTRNLKQIEVLGVPIEKAKINFRAV